MEFIKDIKILTLASLIILATSCAEKDYTAFIANEQYLVFGLSETDANILSQYSGVPTNLFSKMYCKTEVEINEDISISTVEIFTGELNEASFQKIGAIESLRFDGSEEALSFTMNGKVIELRSDSTDIAHRIMEFCSEDSVSEA